MTLAVLVPFVATIGLTAIALTHLRCQSADGNDGYRFESAVTLGILILGVALTVWLNSFITGLTTGPKAISHTFYWLMGIGAVAAIGLLMWAWSSEALELRCIKPFMRTFVPVALASVALSWIPNPFATLVVQVLTAVTAVALLILGATTRQTLDPGYSGWLGFVAGLIVLISRRGGSVEETLAWQLTLGFGIALSAAVLLLQNLFFHGKPMGTRLFPVSRGTLLGAGVLCSTLAFAQLA